MTKLKIVVGGYIVAYPFGGMTWHHLNYLLGLHALGHEVWFLEDSGSYSLPYNPKTGTCAADSTYGRKYLEDIFAQYHLPLRYCYYSEFEDRHYGLAQPQLHELLASADVLLCVSGVTPLRSDRPRPRHTVVIDTDPVFTQVRMQDDADFLAYYRLFDTVATFGRLIGTDRCVLPKHGFRWIPTQQPIALHAWPVQPVASTTFTTLGKWEHTHRSVTFAGETYQSSKSSQWLKFIEIPSQVPWQMELAMQSLPPDVATRFIQQGWQLRDAAAVSESPQTFADFINRSAGEFTVVKEIYHALPSGWFSDRGACFLATGRPVVAQSSGFDQWLPTGNGLFSVDTPEQAVDALNTIDSNHAHHCAAARHLAETQFDSQRVLTDLLNIALS